MILEEPLKFAPAISAIVAAFAAAISAWNAGKSAKNADRQHGVAYASDVARWGAEVLKVLPGVVELYNLQLDRQSRSDRATSIGNELICLYDQSAFIFPNPKAEAPRIVQQMIEQVVADQAALKSADLQAGGSVKYANLRTTFVDAVRQAIGVSKRHSDAKKYLS
ncbi:MAG: hypothetical protein KGQ52_12070 [Alphaproteobacteria bacterium]|nr:hypothetical protein [Alphaproteobacteria bacterium]